MLTVAEPSYDGVELQIYGGLYREGKVLCNHHPASGQLDTPSLTLHALFSPMRAESFTPGASRPHCLHKIKPIEVLATRANGNALHAWEPLGSVLPRPGYRKQSCLRRSYGGNLAVEVGGRRRIESGVVACKCNTSCGLAGRHVWLTDGDKKVVVHW